MIKLNQEQQQVVEFLKKNCKKVDLYANKYEQAEAMCLLEENKVIEVTFTEDNEVCVTYDDIDCDCENQESLLNHEIDKAFIDRMFERVDDVNKRLPYYCNKAHAKRIENFLKK